MSIRFGYTAIIGEELVDNKIVVALYEEKPVEMPKGKKQTHFRVNSIIPDRPYVTDQAAKALAESFLRQAREGKLQEFQIVKEVMY